MNVRCMDHKGCVFGCGSGLLRLELRGQMAQRTTTMRCGYTRCLVHHPGKPLLCLVVNVLRVDTRIQQKLFRRSNPPPIVRVPFVDFKTCNPTRIINKRRPKGR